MNGWFGLSERFCEGAPSNSEQIRSKRRINLEKENNKEDQDIGLGDASWMGIK
jgi:hypothetical protein